MQTIPAMQAALQAKDAALLAGLAATYVADHPGDPRGYYYRGESALLQSEPDLGAAEADFSQAYALQPEEPLWLKAYARLMAETLQQDTAAGIYAQVLQLEPKDEEALRALGLYYLQEKGEPEAAQGYFHQLIGQDIGNLEYHLLLAQAYFENGQVQEAKDSLFFSLHEGAHEPGLVLQIRILEQEVPRPEEELLACYADLYGLAPQNEAYAFQYARALREQGEFAQAAPIWAALNDRYIQQERQAEVIFYENLALNYMGLQAYESALATWDLALSLANTEGGDLHRYYEHRAETLAALGRIEEAHADIEQALSACEDNPIIQSRVQLVRARVYLHSREWDKARQALDLVLEIGVFVKDAEYTLGQLALAQGQEKEAYGHWLRAKDLGSKSAAQAIRSELKGYFEAQKKAIMAQSAQVERQTWPLLRQLAGKFWVFEALRSPDMPKPENMPEEMREFLRQYLSGFVVFFTENWLFFAQPLREAQKEALQALPGVYAYQVLKQQGQGALLALQALDGLSTLRLKLKLDGNQLLWATEEASSFILRPQTLEDLDFATEEQFRQLYAWTLPYLQAELEPQALEILEMVL